MGVFVLTVLSFGSMRVKVMGEWLRSQSLKHRAHGPYILVEAVLEGDPHPAFGNPLPREEGSGEGPFR